MQRKLFGNETRRKNTESKKSTSQNDIKKKATSSDKDIDLSIDIEDYKEKINDVNYISSIYMGRNTENNLEFDIFIHPTFGPTIYSIDIREYTDKESKKYKSYTKGIDEYTARKIAKFLDDKSEKKEEITFEFNKKIYKLKNWFAK